MSSKNTDYVSISDWLKQIEKFCENNSENFIKSMENFDKNEKEKEDSKVSKKVSKKVWKSTWLFYPENTRKLLPLGRRWIVPEHLTFYKKYSIIVRNYY